MREFLAFAALITLASCAHGTMRGTVAMKVSDEEVYVCLGKNAVKPGDRVTLFRNQCTGPAHQGSQSRECSLQKTGEGTITRILNDHYSAMRPDAGSTFNEGTLVQKNRI